MAKEAKGCGAGGWQGPAMGLAAAGLVGRCAVECDGDWVVAGRGVRAQTDGAVRGVRRDGMVHQNP